MALGTGIQTIWFGHTIWGNSGISLTHEIPPLPPIKATLISWVHFPGSVAGQALAVGSSFTFPWRAAQLLGSQYLIL